MSGKLSLKIRKSFPSLEEISIKVLIEAYQSMLFSREYSLDWEEEQFSAYLIGKMNKSSLTKKFNLFIDCEHKLLNEDILPVNTNNPKYLPRIDINIASWSFNTESITKYFFEAKNLCENNWDKISGSYVVASYYQRRYIDTGIENFRNGRYYNGSIIGYVLEGDIKPIIQKLNIRLNKDRNTLQNIQEIKYISYFQDIYNSIHVSQLNKNIELKHIFLKF